MYLMPWYLMPTKWVNVNVTSAQERVVLMLAVGGKKPRNEADQVAGGNVQKDGGDQRKEPAALIARDVHHELLHAREHHFEKILRLAGDHGDGASPEIGQNDQKQHDKPGVDHVRIGLGEVAEADQLKKLDQKQIRVFHP